jgi:hypothetical protein
MPPQTRQQRARRTRGEGARRRPSADLREAHLATPSRLEPDAEPVSVPSPRVPPEPAGLGKTIKTPVGDAPVVPVILILVGAYLAWFGVHYWKTDVKWPTTPIKDVLTGQGLPANTATLSSDEQALETAATAQLSGEQGVTPGTGQANPNAVGQAVASGAAPNQNIGKMLAAAYGWSDGDEWDDLVDLWDRESGWNNQVWNGGSTAATQPADSSGAYGIPQALPYTKMPQAGWPPGYGGTADPTSQITWGLSYIKSTYGTPSAAWQHETTYGWY